MPDGRSSKKDSLPSVTPGSADLVAGELLGVLVLGGLRHRGQYSPAFFTVILSLDCVRTSGSNSSVLGAPKAPASAIVFLTLMPRRWDIDGTIRLNLKEPDVASSGERDDERGARELFPASQVCSRGEGRGRTVITPVT